MLKNAKVLNRHARRAAASKLRKAITREEPGSTLDNLLRERGQQFVDKYLAIVREYGPPPTDREVVVAHEAGHLIVAAAWGGTCTRAYVKQERSGSWVGFVTNHTPGVTDGGNIYPAREPDRAFKWIMGLIAGVVAEHIVGRQHPASALEEVERARGVAAAIALAGGFAPEQVFEAALVGTEGCLRKHFDAFNAVRALFDGRDEVDPEDVNSVMKRFGVSPRASSQGGG